MDINITDIADLGFSYFAFILVAFGVAKGIWPWWRDNYWPSREKRWQEQFEASKVREKMMMDQATEFLAAIQAYQDGFAAANAAQHQISLDLLKTVHEDIQEYNRTNISLFELLTAQFGDGTKR